MVTQFLVDPLFVFIVLLRVVAVLRPDDGIVLDEFRVVGILVAVLVVFLLSGAGLLLVFKLLKVIVVLNLQLVVGLLERRV